MKRGKHLNGEWSGTAAHKPEANAFGIHEMTRKRPNSENIFATSPPTAIFFTPLTAMFFFQKLTYTTIPSSEADYRQNHA
jgi:hypothetical protein